MTNWKSFLLAGALLAGVGAALLLAGNPFRFDIKLGSDPNCMNRESKGVVAVVLDRGSFDFIPPSQIRLGNAPNCNPDTNPSLVTPLRCSIANVGFGSGNDEVCQFSSAELRAHGNMPDAGACKPLYLCVRGGLVPLPGSDNVLCDAKSATCSQ